MKLTNFATSVILLLFFVYEVKCVCVLESDFGFSVNCNFKKSGMFRVRNLGGLKAHFGLGFSVGDELGFPESLGNEEGSRKRSLSVRNNDNSMIAAGQPFMLPKYTTNQPYQREIAQVRSGSITKSSPPKKVNSMTEVLTLPLGVPRFRKLPKDLPKVVSPKAYKVPEFVSLPSSTVEKFESLTKIETYPGDYANMPEVDLKGHTVEELAETANVSKEEILKAIKIRQQQMLAKAKVNSVVKTSLPPSTTSFIQVLNTTTFSVTPEITTKPTTFKAKATTAFAEKKILKKHPLGNQKVMNAPKEYYPVGYDKNFDDNFKSKVSLPATSFHCGDQKHFPGLYADQDLSCMVFHVCALTDEGLVMKSFLCPESTLFDQTILKCNWWFYTDCKSSKSLYDSNLPMSKSYQLMKSLAFFSKNYKSASENTEVQNIKNFTDDAVKKITE